MTPQQMLTALENGMTQLSIAKKLGISRSKVAGAIYRYRKAHGLEADIDKRGAIALRKGENVPRNKRGALPAAKIEGFGDVLERNGCRYISGDVRDGTATYCSGDNEKRGFCAEHYAACYVPVKKEGAA